MAYSKKPVMLQFNDGSPIPNLWCVWTTNDWWVMDGTNMDFLHSIHNSRMSAEREVKRMRKASRKSRHHDGWFVRRHGLI